MAGVLQQPRLEVTRVLDEVPPPLDALRRFSGDADAAHSRGRHNVRMPENTSTAMSGAPPTPSQQRARLPTDHTGWLARVIEVLAVVAAVVFAYLHAAP
jgi:hypothetical protein